MNQRANDTAEQAVGGDLWRALFKSTNTERGCGHKRHYDSGRDSNRLLDGWHVHLRPAGETPPPRTTKGEL